MNDNVVITIFDVESEAYQAFNELCGATYGADYDAYEAGLIKLENGQVTLLDGYSFAPADADTATGMLVGGLIGVLGGPLGVLLGASIGGFAGSTSDTARAVDSAAALAVVASKIYNGETAIVALVSEEEPAFDAVFAKYGTTIIRYDAADIFDDIDRLYELEGEVANQLIEQLRAERKAERKAELEEHRADRRASFLARLESHDQVVSETNKITMDLRPI